MSISAGMQNLAEHRRGFPDGIPDSRPDSLLVFLLRFVFHITSMTLGGPTILSTSGQYIKGQQVEQSSPNHTIGGLIPSSSYHVFSAQNPHLVSLCVGPADGSSPISKRTGR